ncbi:hypothetical protein [Stutzerimonas nitrititolerans]|jgi:hypothetical protein|uniref:hypothetical protein n=1 Tax=Stutzerimonas nitrititolerans TaxID=2482751 RepID=UPI0028B15F91|nr:hypothetical protein [Stutzerimonas nitrititolerans]
MSKVRVGLTVVLGLAVSATASAEWFAKIEDDIFTDGKKGVLIGDIGPSHALAFDCGEDKLTAALIEEGKEENAGPSMDGQLIIKVDQNPPIKMAATYGQRNPTFRQMISYDSDSTLKVLKQIQAAQSKILVGVTFPETGSKWSATASVSGSTRETTRFLEACKLN